MRINESKLADHQYKTRHALAYRGTGMKYFSASTRTIETYKTEDNRLPRTFFPSDKIPQPLPPFAHQRLRQRVPSFSE